MAGGGEGGGSVSIGQPNLNASSGFSSHAFFKWPAVVMRPHAQDAEAYLLLHDGGGAGQPMSLQDAIDAAPTGEDSCSNALCSQRDRSSILTAQLLDQLRKLDPQGRAIPVCGWCRAACSRQLLWQSCEQHNFTGSRVKRRMTNVTASTNPLLEFPCQSVQPLKRMSQTGTAQHAGYLESLIKPLPATV